MPLAKTYSAISPAFGALLARASRDPETATGLALAYAALDTPVRRGVVEAIAAESVSGRVDVSVALAALLGVEPDAEVCREITCALSATAGTGLEATGREQAFFAGDETRGMLLYTRPLFGVFLESLRLQWTRGQGLTRADFFPLTTEETVTRLATGGDRDVQFEEVPAAYAIDRAAAVLWEHRRRHGELPSALQPFADLFSLVPE